MYTDSIFTKPTGLNELIDNAITLLKDHEPGTKEYSEIADQLTRLYKLKEIDVELILKEIELHEKQNVARTELALKEIESRIRQNTASTEAHLQEIEIEIKKREMKLPFGLKPETVAIVAANLAGIAMIIGYERFNVVASKAIGFVSKLK